MNRHAFAISTALVVLAGSAACANHRVPATVGGPNTPRVGWVIMHGHKENPDEEFGCQSNPRTDCAVHASAPSSQAFSEVHVYFHSTNTETKYAGTIRIGFFSGAATSTGSRADATVKPGDVGNLSVVGIVTPKPGRYMLSIDIVAKTQAGAEEHILEDVPVEVREPPAS